MHAYLSLPSRSPAGLAIGIVIWGCLLAGTASAAVTTLPPGSLVQTYPDIMVGGVTVNYDADALTNQLHAGIVPGTGLLFIDQNGLPGPEHTLFNSFFDVFVTIDHAGVASAGTLALSGNYDSTAGPAVSLASSMLTGFVYDPSTGIFEFVFDNTTSTIPGVVSPIGIILAANFFGNPAGFASDFTNRMPVGNADVFGPPPETTTFGGPVPEPSSMIVWSMLSAAAVLAGRRSAWRSG